MNCPTPKVTLLSWTGLPLETVYSVWEASKGTGPLMTPEVVKATVSQAEIEKMFRAVIAQHIPIGEHVDLVFMLENISVSWREQAVRHRIGTKASPERVGSDMVIDILPDLADSSWWSQSMRIQDMSGFASRGEYRMPETIKDAGDQAVAVYNGTMAAIEEGYNTLVKMGVPMEDARDVMPLGAQHRMSWKLNVSALQHIVGKRGCQILQLGIWGPVIQGMIAECVEKIHPIFAEMVTPPCIKTGTDEFKGCVYMEENRRRYTGDDKIPPCSLHAQHHQFPDKPFPLAVIDDLVQLPMKKAFLERAQQYGKFWNRDPYSGTRLG